VEEGQRYAVDSIMFLVGNKSDLADGENRATEESEARVRDTIALCLLANHI